MVLFAATGVMGFSGFAIVEAKQVYQEGNAAYEDLCSKVKSEARALPETAREEQPQVAVPKVDIDYEKLAALNQDVVAWLYCPNSVIDYPVMKTDNYSYYLDHLPDGTKNANGSLFIDYHNASDFSDPLAVIYGHAMKSGSMFGSLSKYKDQGYYENHPRMYLYTEQGNYRMDLLFGCVIDAEQWRERAWMYAENWAELLDYAADHTTFKTDLRYAECDRFAALSTCSYEYNDARYVVIGILRSES
jgi:sortase B